MLLSLIAPIFVSCAPAKPVETQIFAMSTIISQKIYDGESKREAANEVNGKIKEIEKQLSLYIEDSDIDKINKNAGLSAVKVNDFTFELIKTAKELSEKSEGLFDITIAPLTLLWGVTSENPKVPSEAEINEVLALIDYNNIVLDEAEKTVFLSKKGMALDLGGIAKGYIVKSIKEIYEKHGVASAMVSLGGNIYTHGLKPDGAEFTLGIRNPNNINASSYMGTLKSTGDVVATTGAYERYFEEDGKIYSHILSLSTGYPVESDLLSVTVIAEDGGLADYLSTTLFIAGKDNIYSYLNRDNFSVIVIDKNNEVYISDKLKDKFEITDDTFNLHV